MLGQDFLGKLKSEGWAFRTDQQLSSSEPIGCGNRFDTNYHDGTDYRSETQCHTIAHGRLVCWGSYKSM